MESEIHTLRQVPNNKIKQICFMCKQSFVYERFRLEIEGCTVTEKNGYDCRVSINVNASIASATHQ
jgi:hypothetical protein